MARIVDAVEIFEERHLSVTLKRLFDAAEAARCVVLAVLFIDEIDAFGSRELSHDHNEHYHAFGAVTR